MYGYQYFEEYVIPMLSLIKSEKVLTLVIGDGDILLH